MVERTLKGIPMDQLGAAQKNAIETGKKMTASGKKVRYITRIVEAMDLTSQFRIPIIRLPLGAPRIAAAHSDTPLCYNTAPVRMATPTASRATPSSVTATTW
jgi:hypothetical protein